MADANAENGEIAQDSALAELLDELKAVDVDDGPNEQLLPTNFNDCTDRSIGDLSDLFGIEHLLECVDPKLFEYPVAGIVHTNSRLVVPLRVRAMAGEQAKDFVVYFVINTGSPLTSLSRSAWSKIFGDSEQIVGQATIQDTPLNCWKSAAIDPVREDVNILGSQFLLKSNSSIVYSPHPYNNDDGTSMRVFYLTTSDLLNGVNTLANSEHQLPNVYQRRDNPIADVVAEPRQRPQPHYIVRINININSRHLLIAYGLYCLCTHFISHYYHYGLSN